jgi:parvulin-like peptidyl-prolyl isomerase
MALMVDTFAQAPDLARMDFVLQSVPNGPVASVRGVSIPPESFRDYYVGELVHWDKANPETQVNDQLRIAIALRVLRQLIQQEVLFQEADKRGVTVSATELNERWNVEFAKIKQSLPATERDSLTDDQILDQLGATREDARADLHRVLLIGKMHDRIIADAGVTVSDEQLAEWYTANEQMSTRPETIHVKQLFFKAEERPAAVKNRSNQTKAKAKQKADRALLQIQSGQSFEKVARDMSDGQFKDSGGDWGERPAGQLPPFVVEAARKLSPGALSPVVESQYGFHIVKLIAMTDAGKVPLKQAAPEIRRLLTRQKGSEEVHRYCAKTMGDPDSVRVYLDLESQLRRRPELLEMYKQEMKNPQVSGN